MPVAFKFLVYPSLILSVMASLSKLFLPAYYRIVFHPKVLLADSNPLLAFGDKEDWCVILSICYRFYSSFLMLDLL